MFTQVCNNLTEIDFTYIFWLTNLLVFILDMFESSRSGVANTPNKNSLTWDVKAITANVECDTLIS